MVGDIVITEAKQIHAVALAECPQDLGPDVRGYLSEPGGDGVGIAAAINRVREYAAEVRAVLDGVDVLALPSCPIGAPPIGAEIVDVGGIEIQTFFAMSLRTAPFNAAGVPAMSLPAGRTRMSLEYFSLNTLPTATAMLKPEVPVSYAVSVSVPGSLTSCA